MNNDISDSKCQQTIVIVIWCRNIFAKGLQFGEHNILTASINLLEQYCSFENNIKRQKGINSLTGSAFINHSKSLEDGA